MIDPDKLEAMAQVIYERENQFNTYTLEKIAKRVKATGELSAYDQESLKNIADITGDMDAITKELARITKLNIADVEKIYAKTINDGINSYEPLYDFKKIQFKSYKDNEYALKLVRHWAEITAEKMINLSNAKIIGFTDSKGNFTTIAGTYQQVIDDAIVAVSNGTVDFNSAMEETIKRLGGSGVVTNYGNKITRPIESAIRSNILYGAKKAAESYDNYVSEELGLDGFEVDAHSGCRPSHVFMQGKIYSYGGKKTIKGVTYEDGTDALAALEDYGCLHFKTGVLLGVSEPRYSPEELEQIYKETTELIEYNGKKKTLYEWKQTQRRLEREYRKTKTQSDTFKAAGNNAKAREYKEAAKAIKDNYDTMTKTIPGLYKHHERMRTYFKGNKTLTSGTNDDIIKLHQGRQDKHIIGSNNYKNGKSYLTISNDEIKDVIKTKAGTGKRKGDREKVTADTIIGVNVNKTRGFKTLTDKATIHYSKDGSHLVPTHAQLQSGSVPELRKYCKKVAMEYYDTPEYIGLFGKLSAAEKEKRIDLLLSQKQSKTSLIKDIKSMEKKILKSRGEI